MFLVKERRLRKSSGLSPVILSILVIIPLVIIAGLVIFLRNKNEESIPPLSPAQGSFAAPAPQPNATPCFACRQPILSMMQAVLLVVLDITLYARFNPVSIVVQVQRLLMLSE